MRAELLGHAVGDAPILLREGDLIVFPQGDAHVMSNAPGMRAEPDMAAFARTSTPLPYVYEFGGGGADRSRVVCAFMGCDERPYNPLLSALPRIIHLSAADPGAAAGWLGTLLNIASRNPAPAAGGENMLSRLAELMFVEVIRATSNAAGRSERLARRPARSDGRPGARRDARRAARGMDRRTARAGRRLSRRCSPSGSPRWSASRPCSIWRCGGCSSPRACWSTAVTWRMWPLASVTSPKPRSAAHSRSSSARRSGDVAERERRGGFEMIVGSSATRRMSRASIAIGVISDTHGLLRPEAVAALQGSVLILHAGDVGNPGVLDRLRAISPTVAIRGNVDAGAWAGSLPETEAVEVGRLHLYMLHDLARLDVDPKAGGFAAVISGHTHRPHAEMRHGVLYLNPGSAGPRRFNLPLAVARLEVSGDRLTYEIIELRVP